MIVFFVYVLFLVFGFIASMRVVFKIVRKVRNELFNRAATCEKTDDAANIESNEEKHASNR